MCDSLLATADFEPEQNFVLVSRTAEGVQRFWTGGAWSEEYPDAAPYSDMGRAIADADRLEALVIENYGLVHENVAYGNPARVQEVEEDTFSPTFKADTKKYGLSDCDQFVIWQLGMAAWKAVQTMGGSFAHESKLKTGG